MRQSRQGKCAAYFPEVIVFCLFLFPLVVSFLFHHHFVFAKFAAAGFGALLLACCLLYSSIRERTFSVPGSPAFSFLFFWVLWSGITVFWSPVPGLSIRSWAVRLLCLFLFYFFSVCSIRLRWLLIPIFLTSIFVSVLAVLQYYSLDHLVLPHLRAGTVIDLGNFVFAKRAENTVKIYSTFGHRNYLAGYLIIVIPLIIVAALVFICRGRFAGAGRYETVFSYLAGIILLSVAVFLFYVVFLTHARGPVLASVLSFFLLPVLYFFSQRTTKSLMVAGRYFLLIAVCLLVMSGMVYRYSHQYTEHSFVSKVVSSLDLSKGSTGHRFFLWKNAWYIICGSYSNFLIGTGPGTFQANHVKAMTAVKDDFSYIKTWRTRSWYVHNEYLNQWLDCGLVGFALFFCFLWYLFVGLYKLISCEKDDDLRLVYSGIAAALFAMVLHNFVSFSFQLPSAAILFFSLAGWMNNSRRSSGDSLWQGQIGTVSDDRSRLIFVTAVVSVITGIAVVFGSLLSDCYGEYWWRQAFVREKQQQPAQAWTCYVKACKGKVDYPQLHLDMADFLRRNRCWEAALEVYKETLVQVPDVDGHYHMAVCYFHTGDVDSAAKMVHKVISEDKKHKGAIELKRRLGRVNQNGSYRQN